jgi:hypothetical protein
MVSSFQWKWCASFVSYRQQTFSWRIEFANTIFSLAIFIHRELLVWMSASTIDIIINWYQCFWILWLCSIWLNRWWVAAQRLTHQVLCGRHFDDKYFVIWWFFTKSEYSSLLCNPQCQWIDVLCHRDKVYGILPYHLCIDVLESISLNHGCNVPCKPCGLHPRFHI